MLTFEMTQKPFSITGNLFPELQALVPNVDPRRVNGYNISDTNETTRALTVEFPRWGFVDTRELYQVPDIMDAIELYSKKAKRYRTECNWAVGDLLIPVEYRNDGENRIPPDATLKPFFQIVKELADLTPELEHQHIVGISALGNDRIPAHGMLMTLYLHGDQCNVNIFEQHARRDNSWIDYTPFLTEMALFLTDFFTGKEITFQTNPAMLCEESNMCGVVALETARRIMQSGCKLKDVHTVNLAMTSNDIWTAHQRNVVTVQASMPRL